VYYICHVIRLARLPAETLKNLSIMQTISMNEKSLITFSCDTIRAQYYVEKIESLGLKYSSNIGRVTSTFTIEGDFNKILIGQLYDLFN
jgi:ACT domain-containing protein